MRLLRRWGRAVERVCLLLAAAGLPTGPLAAQTAHYLGQQTTVDPIVQYPGGVAVDSHGTVYVSDSSNKWVREETPPSTGSGSYTWVAIGRDQVGAAGPLAVDANRNVYVVTLGIPISVVKLTQQSNGQWAAQTLLIGGGYAGVAVDPSGIVYVSNQEARNSSVLRLTPSGSGYAQGTVGPDWLQPQGLAADGSGNVYVAATSGLYGSVDRVKGNCPGVNCTETPVGAGWKAPFGVAVDGSGNVYVADTMRSNVEEVPGGGGGPEIALGIGLNSPAAVAVDASGAVYIGDSGNNRVVKVWTGPVYFGSWAVQMTSTPAQTMTFYFDTGGTLGSTFVHTTGTTSTYLPPGTDFNDTERGSCKAHHTYNAGDTCTIEATCTPQNVATFGGLAGLENSSGAVIATASLVCNGAPSGAAFSGAGSLGLVCTTYDKCGDVVSYSQQTINQWNQPVGIVSGQNAYGRNPGASQQCQDGFAEPPAETICTPQAVTVGGSGNKYLDRPTRADRETPAGLDKGVGSVKITDVTATSVTLSWTTNAPSQNGVLYQEEGGETRPTPNAASSTAPEFKLEHLKPGTEYRVTVWSYTDADVAWASLSFKTEMR